MKNKVIRLIENILSKVLIGLFWILLIFLVLRMHGFTVDKEYILYFHKWVLVDWLAIIGGSYIFLKFITIIIFKFDDVINLISLKKYQKLQLEQIEDKVIFEEGFYEVLLELQKYKKNETELITQKVKIKGSETIKGFLMTLYRKKECNYLVVSISSIQKVSDLNEIQLTNTLNNLKKER